MADAFQPRRVVLTLRNAVRAFALLCLVSGGLLSAAFVAMWLFPGDLFRWVASAAERAGVTVSLPVVRGNPAAGWTFDNLSARGAGFTVSARRVYVNVDWRSLLRGRPALDSLWADGLIADIRATGDEPDEPGGRAVLPAVHNLKIIDSRFAMTAADGKTTDVKKIHLEGRISPTAVTLSGFSAEAFDNRLAGAGAYDLSTRAGFIDAAVPGCLDWPGVSALDARCVNGLAARVSVRGDRIDVERVAASVSGSTVTATGTFNLAPLSGRMNVSSRGPLVVNADVSGDNSEWNFKGEARAKGNALRFSGAVRLAGVPTYEIDVRAEEIPADLVPGLPPALGFLSGHLTGSARGKKPADIDGKAVFRIAASNGPALEGTVSVVSGLAVARAIVGSGGLAGRIGGRWSLGAMSGEATARLTLDGKGLLPWAGVSADGELAATVKGRHPDLAWTFSTTLSDVESADIRVAKAEASGAGDRLSPPSGKLDLKLEKVTQGDQTVDALILSADGSAARHKVDVSLDSGERSLKGTATGVVAGGRWKSTWTAFSLTLGDTWTAREPFYLTAGGSGVTVTGFRLVNGPSRINIDGGVDRGRYQDLRVRGEGISIAPFLKAFGSGLDMSAVLSLNASASGPLSRPEARVTATARELTVAGKPAGTLTVEGRVNGGRVYAEALTLTGPAGTLDADGSFPLNFKGRRAPPVRIRIRTNGLDPAALPLPTGIEISKSRMDGDLSIVAGRDQFEATGRLAFVAERVRIESSGLDLSAVDVLLTAEGGTLRIAKAVAKSGKKGTVSIDGSVSARDVAMTLRARGFSLDHPSGISARTDGNLALSGTWDAPHVGGNLDILDMDIRPQGAEKKGKARKKEDPATSADPAPRGPPQYSPMSADVRIVFDDNVWYKDGQSAIEFEGNLNLRKESGGPTRLYGTIETVRGEYIFYGRSFEVTRGQLAFLGQAPPDPNLNVRATYVTDESNVKIHMDAAGTFSRPELKLTSEPPMEETDIVSVLVTGRPRGEGGDDAMSESAARLMAANYLAERLRSKLQNQIDVDQLKFNLTEEGAAQVTVGQNVTDDLYVSYGRTLGAEGERRLTAEYTLTPRWSLFGTTSSVGRYVIDLLFKFGYK